MTFFNPFYRYYISTNTKVLSSSLRNQKTLVMANRKYELVNMVLKKVVPVLARPHYLLVRNPYKRVESFFKEKLRKCVLQATADPPYKLKLHQEIFYPYLNIKKEDDLEQIQKKFLSFDFEAFIQLLPSVYMLDSHLRPQSLIIKQKIRNRFSFRFEYDKIFKIEEASSMNELATCLFLDMDVRINATTDTRNEIVWTKKTCQIVNELYRLDFEYFNYPVSMN